jgi:hypothetical protein
MSLTRNKTKTFGKGKPAVAVDTKAWVQAVSAEQSPQPSPLNQRRVVETRSAMITFSHAARPVIRERPYTMLIERGAGFTDVVVNMSEAVFREFYAQARSLADSVDNELFRMEQQQKKDTAT